jgi:hypothetical protein
VVTDVDGASLALWRRVARRVAKCRVFPKTCTSGSGNEAERMAADMGVLP